MEIEVVRSAIEYISAAVTIAVVASSNREIGAAAAIDPNAISRNAPRATVNTG